MVTLINVSPCMPLLDTLTRRETWVDLEPADDTNALVIDHETIGTAPQVDPITPTTFPHKTGHTGVATAATATTHTRETILRGSLIRPWDASWRNSPISRSRRIGHSILKTWPMFNHSTR